MNGIEIWQPDESRCPDMQKLVDHFGDYHLIPPEEWAEFRAANDLWWTRHCAGEFWNRAKALPTRGRAA